MIGCFMDTPNGLVPKECPKFDAPYPVIVMELLEGGDLYTHIFNLTSVTEGKIAKIFHNFILALRSIHEKGYIHRDLKLSNLKIILPSQHVKLIDFG